MLFRASTCSGKNGSATIGKSEVANIEVRIEGGQSFLDPMFASLKIDPIEGFQLIDATSFERGQLELRQHLIFCRYMTHSLHQM